MRLATVALSGGLDSTAALLKLMKSGEYDYVTAHHVRLQTQEGIDRVEAEFRACSKIYEWFRDNGMPYFYTWSSYECLYDRTSNTPDIVIVAPIVTQAMLAEANIINKNLDPKFLLYYNIAYGDHKDEFDRPAFVGRWDLVVQIFHAIMNTAYKELRPYTFASVQAPNAEVTKKEVYEYLPPELRALTTTCRKGRDCGNCRACLELEACKGE